MVKSTTQTGFILAIVLMFSVNAYAVDISYSYVELGFPVIHPDSLDSIAGTGIIAKYQFIKNYYITGEYLKVDEGGIFVEQSAAGIGFYSNSLYGKNNQNIYFELMNYSLLVNGVGFKNIDDTAMAFEFGFHSIENHLIYSTYSFEYFASLTHVPDLNVTTYQIGFVFPVLDWRNTSVRVGLGNQFAGLGLRVGF